MNLLGADPSHGQHAHVHRQQAKRMEQTQKNNGAKCEQEMIENTDILRQHGRHGQHGTAAGLKRVLTERKTRIK